MTDRIIGSWYGILARIVHIKHHEMGGVVYTKIGPKRAKERSYHTMFLFW
jgi:hypothetical protein